MLLLDKNYFEVLNLPRGFSIDTALLEQRYRDLMAAVHPDRFVTESPEQRRLAMQAATLANEAWRCLRDPVERAAYLCRLGGQPVDSAARARVAPDFLAEQMAWRESLDEARDAGDREAVLALQSQVSQLRGHLLERLRRLIDDDGDFSGAAGSVSQLMYVTRFVEQIDDALDGLA